MSRIIHRAASLIAAQRTLSITIASASRDDVDAAVQKILRRIAPGRYQRRVGPLDVGSLYRLTPPRGAAHLHRIMIYSPAARPNTCVIATNLADGWSSLGFLISRELKKFQLRVNSTAKNAPYPQNLFCVWQNGVQVRTVMSMRDSDKWVFVQRGEALDFEDPSLYEAKIRRDRLDRGILLGYLMKIGYDLKDDAFWNAPDAIHLEEAARQPSDAEAIRFH